MKSLVTGWADKITDSIGSPVALKVGFMFWSIILIASQLAIVFYFIEPKIDVTAGILDSLKAIFSAGSLLAFGKLFVTAVALILIKIKVLVFIVSFGAVIAVAFLPVLISDNLIEPVNELILLGEIGLAVVVIGLGALEVLPFIL